MLGLKFNSAVEALRELSVAWRGRFTEQYGAAKLVLNNNIGQGSIASFDIMPGLSVLTYDIRFKDEVVFEEAESNWHTVHFIYCLEGYWFHKFNDEEGTVKISNMQNIVIQGLPGKSNFIRIPPNVNLKFSIISITANHLVKNPSPRAEYLTQTLKEVLEIVDDGETYKYFGEINMSIAEHAKFLIHNNGFDTVGRLIAEASILKTLASQLQSLQESKESPYRTSILTVEELEKLVGLNGFISKNMSRKITISELALESGLSPKKIQAGMRHLYGESVNVFLKNVKLEYAKDLLENTDRSISEVSYDIGINSRSYFSKIFKERFGILPIDLSKKVLSDEVLYELSYRSQMSEDISDDDINDIVLSARRNNDIYKVTGCLITYKDMFFQYLEGPKRSVLDLYEILLNDPRHYDVKLLWKGLTLNRLFEDWSLAVVSEDEDLNIKVDGVIKNIKIEEDLDIDDECRTISGDLLWRRVRNFLKTTA